MGKESFYVRSKQLLSYLICRGDSVSITKGRLVIHPASGKPVADSWMVDHAQSLITEIMEAVGAPGYEYVSYTAGTFGKRFPGVSLHFVSMSTGEPFYAIFNADLKRKRKSKYASAGAARPKGQFSVGKGSGFYGFWTRTALPYPSRLCTWHKQMGHLKRIVFTAQQATKKGTGLPIPERLDAKSLSPLEVTVEQIIQTLGDKLGTRMEQGGNNMGTRTGNKESHETQIVQGMQPKPTTCSSNYGKRLTGNTDIRESITPITSIDTEQSDDDFWADYDRAGAHEND